MAYDKIETQAGGALTVLKGFEDVNSLDAKC